MKNNISVLKSRYGSTDVVEEFLRYPFEAPISYDYDYSGTYSKYSIVDKNYVDTLVKPHKRLVSGGTEWGLYGQGMTFSVSNLYYSFTGEILSYSASFPNLTFDNGVSSPRIDAVVMNEGNTLSIVKGVPGNPPVKPVISDSQILVQYCYINASSTVIGDSEIVYLNGNQWDISNYQLSGQQSGTYLPTASDDFISNNCVELNTDFRTGVKFRKFVGGITASEYGSLSMRIKFTSIVPDNKNLFAQIQGTANGALVYGNTLNLMTFGLHRDVVNDWQHIIVPTSKFGNDMALYNALTLRMAGGASGSNTLWRADSILLQKGWNYDGYMGEPDSNGSSGNTNTVTGGVIGPAEFGDDTYTDGVFTDFNTTTTIGTAVDRFNELFLALVPPPAPELTDYTGVRSGGVNGKLSFDDSNPIAEATYSGANTALSPIPVDGTWLSSVKKLSIYAANSVDLTGLLANNVTADSNGAYVANSFRDATTGNLTLNVNGTIVSTINLSSTENSINNTSVNTISGFILNAATFSKFPNGKPFVTSNPMFKSRTGTWVVKGNDVRIRNGYNYIIVEHKSTSSSVFTRTLTRIEFIQDANTVATTFNDFEIPNYSLTGSKHLSGIQYYTGGYIEYNGTMSNLYRNTYYKDGDAITFNDNSTGGNANTNPILNVSQQYSLVNSGGNELKDVKLSTDFNSSNPLQFNIITPGKRRLNDPIGITTTAKRTLQGNSTGGGKSITNVYLDNVNPTSTDTFEGFDDENKRLIEGAYTLVTEVTTSGIWSSAQSLIGSDSGHNTGLQVYNSKLIYPTLNFILSGTTPTNPNFGISNRNYTTAAGQRTYIRSFYKSTTHGNFSIVINGTSTTFVTKVTSLTSNNAWLEIKLPSATGWMDCKKTFDSSIANPWADGAGAYANGPTTLGGTWNLTTGTKKTNLSGNYVVIKITTGASWTGSITDITFGFN